MLFFSQPIFRQLKNPALLIAALGFMVLFFDLQLWMMWNLPGSRDEMCVIGAGLTFGNILYAVLMSVMFGIFIPAFYLTFREKQASYGSLSLSSIAMAIGSLTVICASCTFQALTIFGIVIGLQSLTSFNLWFKLLSLGMMGYGLYHVNRQLKHECARCVD